MCDFSDLPQVIEVKNYIVKYKILSCKTAENDADFGKNLKKCED